MFAQAKSSLAAIALLLSLPLMVQAAPPITKGPPTVEVMVCESVHQYRKYLLLLRR